MPASSLIWLYEPTSPDPTYARRGEPTLEWLARSTLPRAVECRRFLNQNLSALPPSIQSAIQVGLRARWPSAFFELIVARLLQVLGAAIQMEQPNAQGRRPDFLARFSDGTVVVEAVSPIINAVAGDEVERRMPLLDLIEERVPEGWHADVVQLPNLGPSDSKRPFKSKISTMLSFPQPSLDDKSTELIEELPEGVIHLRLRPAPQSPGRVTIEPGIGFIDNTEERIRYALAKKRRQVRQSQSPVLLAIEGSGLSSDLEDFDKALFGRTFGRVNLQGEEVERGFQSDGEFMKQKNKPPTYAGVLAFVEVGFAYVADPVLYLHPRFAGALPEPILGLERRSYDPQGNMVRIEPAQLVNLSRGLHLVQR